MLVFTLSVITSSDQVLASNEKQESQDGKNVLTWQIGTPSVHTKIICYCNSKMSRSSFHRHLLKKIINYCIINILSRSIYYQYFCSLNQCSAFICLKHLNCDKWTLNIWTSMSEWHLLYRVLGWSLQSTPPAFIKDW